MRPKLLKVGTISLSFVLGGSVASLFMAHRCRKADPQVVNTTVSYRCPSVSELVSRQKRLLVIAVASDDEFYIGRKRVALSEIPGRVRDLVGEETPDLRVVFIKASDNVRYRTVSSIVQKIKEADVYRVELVPPFKKGSPDNN